MLRFILLHHVLCLVLVFSPRNVRVCDYLRMIFGTRLHCHHTLFCSFPTIITKRRRLSHRSMLRLVVDSPPRTVSFNNRDTDPHSIPYLNLLFESSFVWDESSTSNTDVTVIPSQSRIIQQILSHWQPFRDLKLMFARSRRAEQLRQSSQQNIVDTVEDYVLRTVMADLESQEEDAPKCIHFFKPMSCLGRIRPHRRYEVRVPKRTTTGRLTNSLSFSLSWLPTLRTRGVRYLWCWISSSPTTVSEVTLT
jgi:hypothetical protein